MKDNPLINRLTHQTRLPVSKKREGREAEAIRMILGETQRAKERVHTMGAIGWSRSSIPRIKGIRKAEIEKVRFLII